MSGELRRQEISDAVSGLGWRYILGTACTCVHVASLAQAAEVAGRVVAVAGPRDGQCLSVDIRPDRLILSLQSRATGWVTGHEIDLAHRISGAMADAGLATTAGTGGPRSVQALEIAIDAIDIDAVRPFWKAVLGYRDEYGEPRPGGGLIDPLGQGPAFWFQQMDAPRQQRNRIHIDISVPHDEAQRRIGAALAAGGTLLSDAEAPAFWVLADAEGNEACITTWQGRDS